MYLAESQPGAGTEVSKTKLVLLVGAVKGDVVTDPPLNNSPTFSWQIVVTEHVELLASYRLDSVDA